LAKVRVGKLECADGAGNLNKRRWAVGITEGNGETELKGWIEGGGEGNNVEFATRYLGGKEGRKVEGNDEAALRDAIYCCKEWTGSA
jgi:hypothetical protein